jgi:hypothetical protein
MPQAASAHDTFWDFISLMPESMHMIMWVMSDRAIPRSFRFMEGFGVHTFRMVNAKDERGGSACLDSAPLVLSGFLPGLSNAGPGDFVAAEGGRSPTAAATKSWRGYAAATNACTPK